MLNPIEFTKAKFSFAFWLLVTGLIVGIACLVRPPYPLDETRYLGVAWEMWHRHQFMVPLLNGASYAHKPPLLFWLLHLGWSIVGVTVVWARSISALFALASLFIVRMLAKKLWPSQLELSELAPYILLGSALWLAWIPIIRFDLILTFFVLLALYGLVNAVEQQRYGWSLYAIAIGLGVLTKGPVILLFTVAPALTVTWWTSLKKGSRWYRHMFMAIGFGGVIALSWAIPAAYLGGHDYAQAIFWRQSMGRISNSFAHARSFWWYIPTILYMFFPWTCWPRFWRGLRCLKKQGLDNGLRFILSVLLPSFILLSLVSAKQARYLYPLFPFLALFVCKVSSLSSEHRQRDQWIIGGIFIALGMGLLALQIPMVSTLFPKISSWLFHVFPLWSCLFILLGVLYGLLDMPSFKSQIFYSSLLIVLSVICYFSGVISVRSQLFDVKPIAHQVAKLQQKDKPIAYVGHYADQFHFAGRLKQPIQNISFDDINQWLKENPDGYVIENRSQQATPRKHLTLVFRQPYKKGFFVIWHYSKD